MSIKLGKVVTYHERLPSLKSYDVFIKLPSPNNLEKTYLLVTKSNKVVT